MVTPRAQPFAFDISGGELCLDFANTIDNRYDIERRAERLLTYEDFASWCRQTGLVDERAHRELVNAAKAGPDEARAVLKIALALRDAIHEVFAAAAQDKAAPQPSLDTLNDVVRAALGHAEIVREGRVYRWTWEQDRRTRLEQPLWPIAKSAADLLTSDRLATVRLCAAAGCGWLFLDTSRNQSRRWCDMKVCGNREKARRHRKALRTSA
jgi:predicted RNA-binding Zn ribbon-like protein